MTEQHKHTLEMANAAIVKGDYETFLSCCTDDTEWEFVGEQVLKGKEQVRKYLHENYLAPPKLVVTQMVAEGETLAAVGNISLKDAKGRWTTYDYLDLWQFREGKMHQLKAFVIKHTALASVAANDEAISLIGSGYSYNEAAQPTDQPSPLDSAAHEKVVPLPDLGKPLRP